MACSKTLNQENGTPSDGPEDGLMQNGGSPKRITQRLTLGLPENPKLGNPGTSQRLPPLSPLSPINIVHPSKGRRGSYL